MCVCIASKSAIRRSQANDSFCEGFRMPANERAFQMRVHEPVTLAHRKRVTPGQKLGRRLHHTRSRPCWRCERSFLYLPRRLCLVWRSARAADQGRSCDRLRRRESRRSERGSEIVYRKRGSDKIGMIVPEPIVELWACALARWIKASAIASRSGATPKFLSVLRTSGC